jgi:hypothetical protein
MENVVTTIRPSLVTFIIFSMIGLIICLPGIDALRVGQWQGMVFVLIGCSITVGPVLRYMIWWDSEVVGYRGVFVTRRIDLSKIKKFDVCGPQLNERFAPTLGIRIFSAISGDPVIIINIKPFARRDIMRFKERLHQAVRDNQ